MKTIEQRVILRSDAHYGRKVPPGPLGQVLRELPLALRDSVRMAFGGRSTARGKRPTWLDAASDIRFVDYTGDDETVLHFEAPRFGDAAAELYEQQEIWPTKPDPADTGFDLLADIVSDVSGNNRDSDRFDRPMLSRLSRFDDAIQTTFQEIAITGHRYAAESPGILNQSVIETAKSLSSNTPEPQQSRVVGCLDMIRASTQTFALKLDDGEEIKGVLENGDIADSTDLFRKRVMVLGRAVFRASGRLLRIDADEMTSAPDEGAFFSAVPLPTRQRLGVLHVVREQQHKRGLAAVIGMWPGDETDEQIERALQGLG